ncbi:hypothetical protein SAMN04487857_104300 [Pseudomonas sp. ok272]|nr:hypothetical protein SAMN04487857_104300 [Pseudomonas sp. ok272]SFM62288.1 hypothetical protein SAMN04487858_104300 [Pseudomonas sp. ok602]
MLPDPPPSRASLAPTLIDGEHKSGVRANLCGSETAFAGKPVSLPPGDYLQTAAMASASKSRRVASIPATLARPELTMYTLWWSRSAFTCAGLKPV